MMSDRVMFVVAVSKETTKKTDNESDCACGYNGIDPMRFGG